MLKKTHYLVLTMLFLLIELCIDQFFHDRFIRPVLGDYLIVFLVYFGLKTLINLKPVTAVIIATFFAYVVETMQYINILSLLNLKPNTLTRLTLGSSFSWEDMLAYTLGGLTIYYLEYYVFIKFTTKKE